MRVVAFRHVPFEGLGLIEPALRERGIDVEFADMYRTGTEPPETHSASGLIFMGGPMAAYEPLAYIEQEILYIQRAVEAGQPVLGVCLGAQLLARSLGAQVRRNPVNEIGWFEIRLTEAGRQDPLLGALDPSETVFHWHRDTFDLPPGAVWLARSDRCRNQAFRAGSNLYGLQFHLEVTPEMIADWCQQDANCGDVRELDAPLDAHRNAARLAHLAGQVFGRWCDSLSRR